MKRLKSEPIDNAAYYDDQIKMWVDSEFLKLEKRVEALENKPVKKPLRSIVREPPEGFIGRTELIQEITLLCDQEKSVLLTGSAGFGKTSVALKVGSNLVERDRKVIFCEFRSDISSGEDIAKVVMSVIDEDEVQKDPVQALRSWAKELKERVLLVLDALEMKDLAEPFVDEVLQKLQVDSSQKVSFLITSCTKPRMELTIRHFDLEPLPLEDSIAVITDSARRNSTKAVMITDEGKKKLATLCGNMPLALCVVGARLCDFSESVVIEQMQMNPIDMLGSSKAFSFSFTKLDSDLQKLFVRMTVFAGPFTIKAVMDVTQATEQDIINAIKELRKRCLLEKHGDSYSIHRLIHAFVHNYGKENAEEDLREAENDFLKCYTSSLLDNSKLYWTKDRCTESLSRFMKDRDNFEQVLRMSYDGMKEEDENVQHSVMEVWKGCFEEARNVALYIECCVSLKLYHKTLTCFLQIAERSKLLCPQLELLCLIGHEMRRKGEREEYVKRMEEADKVYISVLEQTSRAQAYYSSAKGRYLGYKGERKEAIEEFTGIVTFCENLRLPSLTVDYAKAVLELGHNEKNSKQGDKKLALKKHEKALQMYEEQLGEHMLTAFALKDLADCYLFYNEFDVALSTYKKAEEMFNSFEKYLIKKDLILFMKNLGKCYEKLGSNDESLQYYLNAKDAADKELEGNHKFKFWVTAEMAELCAKMGKQELAIELANEARRIGNEMNLSDNDWRDHKSTLQAIVERPRQ